MVKRTDESIKAKLLELQAADLELIRLVSSAGLTFSETMEYGSMREEIGKDIVHELRLWLRRGYTIQDLFKGVEDP